MEAKFTEPVAASKLKLSEIKFFHKNYAGSNMSIPSGTYVGRISTRGSELISDVSEAHTLSRKPLALDMYDSETHPGDLVGLPLAEVTPDSVPLTWTERGLRASADTGKLLTSQHISIPKDSRLVVELYPDNHSELGAVVGFRLKGAEFKPKTKHKKITQE